MVAGGGGFSPPSPRAYAEGVHRLTSVGAIELLDASLDERGSLTGCPPPAADENIWPTKIFPSSRLRSTCPGFRVEGEAPLTRFAPVFSEKKNAFRPQLLQPRNH